MLDLLYMRSFVMILQEIMFLDHFYLYGVKFLIHSWFWGVGKLTAKHHTQCNQITKPKYFYVCINYCLSKQNKL